VLGFVLLGSWLFSLSDFLLSLLFLHSFGLGLHDGHLLGRDDTLIKVEIDEFQPADIIKQLINVGEHLFTVVNGEESDVGVVLNCGSVLPVQIPQPSAVDVYKLVDVGLPVELLTFLEPFGLLEVGVNV
jgi:hypothetical protein